MKTIFRILAILVLAALVAGGLYLAFNTTSLASDTEQRGEPPTFTSTDGQTFQPRERPDGDENEASLGRGFAGVISTFAKLTIIVIVVVLTQKAFTWFTHRRLLLATHKME